MSYEQAVKHSRNHRKDRFVQQCSGYFGDGSHTDYPADAEEKSFNRIVFDHKTQDLFPIFVRQGSGGIWSTTVMEDCFGTVVNSPEELENLGEYLGYRIQSKE